MREACAITPMFGNPIVVFKLVFHNQGEKEEGGIIVRVEVSQPFHHFGTTSTTLDKGNNTDIRGGESRLISCPIEAPSADYIEHCSITITATIFGESKVWDTATFSDSW